MKNIKFSTLSALAATIVLITACNKETIQPELPEERVERNEISVDWIVKFDKQQYTLHIDDLANYDYSFKELKNEEVNDLYASNNLHIVASGGYVELYSTEAEADLAVAQNIKNINFASIKFYKNDNYTGSTVTKSSPKNVIMNVPELNGENSSNPIFRSGSYKVLSVSGVTKVRCWSGLGGDGILYDIWTNAKGPCKVWKEYRVN